MRLTGVTTCAYCGLPFTEEIRLWMTMQLDHVVPVSVGKALNVPDEFVTDPINFVLACSRCNGFRNRYRASQHSSRAAWTLDEFLDLRDEVFRERNVLVAEACALEIATFSKRPWEPQFEVVFPGDDGAPGQGVVVDGSAAAGRVTPHESSKAGFR